MKKLFSNIFLFFPVILITVFFGPNLLKGKIPIPADSLVGLYHPFRDISLNGYTLGRFPTKNPLITDPVLQTYPWRKITIDDFKMGSMPLWNPYSFGGQPLSANVQSGSFQIFNLLFFIFNTNIAWALNIILPSILASIFLYLFLKEVGLSKEASAFGAMVFPFCGFFIAWLTWGTITTTAAWLPLGFLSIEKLFKKITSGWFLIATFSTSQIFLSGHSQSAFYALSATFFFIIFKLLSSRKKSNFFLCLWSFILGILVCAVQIIPTVEFITLSARNLDQGYFAGRKDWFIPLQNLIQFLAPDYFGNPATYNYWGIWNYAEFIGFVGIMPITLALISFFKKSKYTLFFVLILLSGLTLGIANPLSKIPYVFHIPFVESFQPSRILFLICFSLAVLSSMGLEHFLQQKVQKKNLPLFFLPLILTIAIAISTFFLKNLFPQIANLDPRHIALRNLIMPLFFSSVVAVVLSLKFFKVPKIIIIGLVFAITTIELFRFANKFTPFTTTSAVFPKTKTTQFLKQQEKPFRVATMDRRLMHPNSSTVYGIESIDGYDPLYLTSYAQYISVMQSNNPDAKISSFNRIVTPEVPFSKLADLLNVKYIFSFNQIDSPQYEKVLEEGETKVYQNKNALPRAFFVNEVVKTTKEYAKLLESDFDLSSKATSNSYSFMDKNAVAKLKVIDYKDNKFTLETESNGTKPLLVTNIFYPGWQAQIDGKISNIIKADAIFQMIEVPAGKHTVEFIFRPNSFYNGLYLSFFGVALTLGSALLILSKNSYLSRKSRGNLSEDQSSRPIGRKSIWRKKYQ